MNVINIIQGRKASIPDYLKHNGLASEVENVFYLLGDYYFKNKDWAKAIEHYLLDLTLVPSRFDSWAALALATASRLETKLNSCERLKNVAVFLDRAEAALRCFRYTNNPETIPYLHSSHQFLSLARGPHVRRARD